MEIFDEHIPEATLIIILFVISVIFIMFAWCWLVYANKISCVKCQGLFKPTDKYNSVCPKCLEQDEYEIL